MYTIVILDIIVTFVFAIITLPYGVMKTYGIAKHSFSEIKW